ncbi:hypothetical protein C3408_19370 [Candidatus Pantoea alvi]|nr:hypothetical protein C3408_19370 [Pantoea alvi]
MNRTFELKKVVGHFMNFTLQTQLYRLFISWHSFKFRVLHFTVFLASCRYSSYGQRQAIFNIKGFAPWRALSAIQRPDGLC